MFNFFSKTKQDLEKTNSLDKIGSPADTIKNFLSFAQKTTDKRKSTFNRLMTFVLESNQWTTSELNLKDSIDDSALTFNFSEEYVARYIARLFPRNNHTGVIEIGVKIGSQDKINSKKYEDEILSIYHQNEIPEIVNEQGLNFLVGGAGCFYYPIDKITKRAQIFSIDPKKCFLGWQGGRLVQFAFQDYQGDNKFKTTYYDLSKIIIHDGLTDTYISMANDYNFIPFSWIPNSPLPHTHEGLPKTLLLSEFDRLYNRTSSNFDKRIEDNTIPHMIIKSDIADVGNVQRGKNKKTRIGKDDDVKYLELKEGSEIINWLDIIEKRVVNKTGIIHSAGNLKSNISGKSLSYQYSDMMDLIGFMRLKWDKAFREMNTAILTYKYGSGVYPTNPIYQPFLVQDNNDRVDQYAIMIENNLISHRDAIDELRGVENADEKIKMILEERKLFREDNENKKSEPVKKEIN